MNLAKAKIYCGARAGGLTVSEWGGTPGGWIAQVSDYNTVFGVLGSRVLWIAGWGILREVDSAFLDQ